mmetsp:Transcript_15893/g.24485  ORF Transcript_15893/g.24485 Transcript_15893/m.24485 type:complete len:270 (+) Transcript_15893:1430-2239(+)
MKHINDCLLGNINNLLGHLSLLRLSDSKAAYLFKYPNRVDPFEVVELIVSGKFHQFTALFKQEIQTLSQNFLKKKDTLKNEGCKLLINGQLSKSGMPFEVKSNNVMVFREQLVADFMDLSLLLDRYNSSCMSAKNFFQYIKPGNSEKLQIPRVNIQLGINRSLRRAKTRLSKLSSGLDKAQKAISYEEQMRNMQLLELNKKEMIQIKAELFTVKKDYEKLDSEQQKQGVGFQKYKTLAKVSQDKASKMQGTFSQVHDWLGDIKTIVNYD